MGKLVARQPSEVKIIYNLLNEAARCKRLKGLYSVTEVLEALGYYTAEMSDQDYAFLEEALGDDAVFDSRAFLLAARNPIFEECIAKNKYMRL